MTAALAGFANDNSDVTKSLSKAVPRSGVAKRQRRRIDSTKAAVSKFISKKVSVACFSAVCLFLLMSCFLRCVAFIYFH